MILLVDQMWLKVIEIETDSLKLMNIFIHQYWQKDRQSEYIQTDNDKCNIKVKTIVTLLAALSSNS